MSMFAHYSLWVVSFSEKIHSLAQITSFPLPPTAVKAFVGLKWDIASSAIAAVDPYFPSGRNGHLQLRHGRLTETIRTTRSVLLRNTFAVRTTRFSDRERYLCNCGIIEEMATLLIGRHFILVANQKFVSFMYNPRKTSWIKTRKNSQMENRVLFFILSIVLARKMQ